MTNYKENFKKRLIECTNDACINKGKAYSKSHERAFEKVRKLFGFEKTDRISENNIHNI